MFTIFKLCQKLYMNTYSPYYKYICFQVLLEYQTIDLKSDIQYKKMIMQTHQKCKYIKCTPMKKSILPSNLRPGWYQALLISLRLKQLRTRNWASLRGVVLCFLSLMVPNTLKDYQNHYTLNEKSQPPLFSHLDFILSMHISWYY